MNGRKVVTGRKKVVTGRKKVVTGRKKVVTGRKKVVTGRKKVVMGRKKVVMIPLGHRIKQPRRRQQQKPHKFAYLTMQNSIFARFARTFFSFFSFSFFLGHEMICFAVVWTM